MVNRHFHIINDDITDTKISNKYELITCISVLEHIKEFNTAIKNMFFLLKPKGFLIITLPYSNKKYIENVYEIKGSDAYQKKIPYICQSFAKENLSIWLKENNVTIIDQEYWQFYDGEYWSIGNQVIPPKIVDLEKKHQLACFLFQKLK